MTITTLTRIISTATCDGPSMGIACDTRAIESPTSVESLARALIAAGWRVDGGTCVCPACEKALMLSGKMGPRDVR